MSERRFIKDFQKVVNTYIDTYLEVERSMDEAESYFPRQRRQTTDKEIQALVNKWKTQRDAVVSMSQRASELADKYGVHEQFYDLIKMRPGEDPGYDNPVRLSGSTLLLNISDTFLQLNAAIRNQPAFPFRVARQLGLGMTWLFPKEIQRTIFGWAIVISAICLLLRYIFGIHFEDTGKLILKYFKIGPEGTS
jgi:hypothetical protein